MFGVAGGDFGGLGSVCPVFYLVWVLFRFGVLVTLCFDCWICCFLGVCVLLS